MPDPPLEPVRCARASLRQGRHVGLYPPGAWEQQPCPAAAPDSSGALAAGTQTRISSSPGKEVGQIKKEGTGIKRVNINVETGLHNAFKAATATQGVDMTTVLMRFIQDYVGKYQSAAAKQKKSRRA